MKNYISLIVLVCFGFLLADCNKHKDRPLYIMDSDSLISARFGFKEGSYWIYRDSLDGRVDSFYVSRNYTTHQGTENAVYEFHYVVINQVNQSGGSVADSARWIYDFRDFHVWVSYSYGRNGYGWAQTITFSPLFFYPYELGDLISSFDTAKVLSIDSFSSYNGLPYYKVAKVHHYINATPTLGVTRLDDMFYINDSVGIVKMKLWHPLDNINRNWELQRYKIVK